MKAKTIKKVLCKKLEDWLSSVDDKEVEQAIRKDAIVTGGAIASMLLGEAVNDYDVYFFTQRTAKLVADYYAKKFNDANPSKAPVSVYISDTKNSAGVNEKRVIFNISGSGVVAETGRSIDLDEDEQIDIDERETKYRPIFISENAISLSESIQIIVRFYGSPDEIHRYFDFVHPTNWYSLRDDHLELPAKALECLLSKTIIYRGSLYPIASMFRLRKFIKRGWNVSIGQMLKIAWQISELDMTNIDTMKDQLTGVDLAYLNALIEIIKNEKQPDEAGKCTIDSAWISTIIDRLID